MALKVAIASDHAGYELKELIKGAFAGRVEWLDLGPHNTESVNYAEYGLALGRAVAEGQAERGIAICGSGIGISIAANRYASVRSALCTNVTMARLCRLHNDANVLALGARIIGTEVALDCVQVFFDTEFEGGRHEQRVKTLCAAFE